MKRLLFLITAALLFSDLAFAQVCPTSTRVVNVIVPDFTGTQVRGINSFGEIVGIYRDSESLTHGFLSSYGVLTFLDFPGAVQTLPRGINDQGVIVGMFYDAAENLHGFVRQASGQYIQIDYPGALYTAARGINNRGQIVGDYGDPDNVRIHGFVLTGTRWAVFDFPGAVTTQGYGINDSGQIVGSYTIDGSTLHAYMNRNGRFTSYDYPGASATEFLGLNNAGQAIGYYTDTITNHSMLFCRGKVSITDPAGATFAIGRAVNDLGVSAGNYNDGEGNGYGSVSIPTH